MIYCLLEIPRKGKGVYRATIADATAVAPTRWQNEKLLRLRFFLLLLIRNSFSICFFFTTRARILL